MLVKDLGYYKKLHYNVIIEKQEYQGESWYIAYAEELGKYACYGRGNSEAEALKSFNEEKELFIEYLFNEGKNIPEPKDREKSKFSGIFNVRTSSIIHSKLVNQAKELNISLNLYLNQILATAVERKHVEMQVIDKLTEISEKIDKYHFVITELMDFKDNDFQAKYGWDAKYSGLKYLQTA